MLKELKKYYIEKKSSPEEFIADYSGRLRGDEEKGLFKAATRLLGAYCASPAFNKNLQLDTLAEHDDDMKILKVLIREYDSGVEQILGVYDEYFALKEKPDFWNYFDRKIGLPNGWYRKAKLEIITERNEILKLIKKYHEDEYWNLINGDKIVVEDYLDWLTQNYTLEELENTLEDSDWKWDSFIKRRN